MKVDVNAHLKEVKFDGKGAKLVLEVTGGKSLVRARAATALAGNDVEVTIDDLQDELPFDDEDAEDELPLDDVEVTIEVIDEDDEGEAEAEPEPAVEASPEPEPVREVDVLATTGALEFVAALVKGHVAELTDIYGGVLRGEVCDGEARFSFTRPAKPPVGVYQAGVKRTIATMLYPVLKPGVVDEDERGCFAYMAFLQSALSSKPDAEEAEVEGEAIPF